MLTDDELQAIAEEYVRRETGWNMAEDVCGLDDPPGILFAPYPDFAVPIPDERLRLSASQLGPLRGLRPPNNR